MGFDNIECFFLALLGPLKLSSYFCMSTFDRKKMNAMLFSKIEKMISVLFIFDKIYVWKDNMDTTSYVREPRNEIA